MGIPGLYGLLADRRQERPGRAIGAVEFYRGVLRGLPSNGLIFDVGANLGLKTDVFLRLGARVVAVDPDPANQRALRDRFLRYRVTRKPVVVVDAALSDVNAMQTLWIEAPGSALNTLSRKWVEALEGDERRFGRPVAYGQQTTVRTTTLDALIVRHGEPYFVKIDVEGFEGNVLRGLRRRVPYLSFEVNLPEFLAEGLECVALLKDLAADGMFNYTSDVRGGLRLNRWVIAEELSEALAACRERSVEVFWRTTSAS
jgi:FkbM family methyltransferase